MAGRTKADEANKNSEAVDERIAAVAPDLRRGQRRAVAFRLLSDVVDMADAAAAKHDISRNKIVELVLRDALSKFKGVTPPDRAARKDEPEDDSDDQFDLFS